MDKESKGASVPIPEEFQKKVQELLKGANRQQLSFVRDCCYQCESDMKPEPEFSTESMPS